MSVQIQLHMDLLFGSLIIKSSSARLVCLFLLKDFFQVYLLPQNSWKKYSSLKSDLPLGDEFARHSFKIILFCVISHGLLT